LLFAERNEQTALLMCEIRKIFPYEFLRGEKIPGYVIAESRPLL
jgi:hypothetical protein